MPLLLRLAAIAAILLPLAHALDSLSCSGPNGLKIDRIGTFVSNEDSPVEIIAYDKFTKRLAYVGGESEVVIVDMSNPAAVSVVRRIDLGDGTSANAVAVSQTSHLAVAISNDDDPTANGKVQVWDLRKLELLAEAEVGPLPDHLTWSPNGRKIYVALEGEPESQEDEDSGSDPTIGVNPAGGFAILTLRNGPRGALSLDVKTLSFVDYFDAMDQGRYDALRAAGLRIDPRLPSKADAGIDVEPEYVSLSHDARFAYVALQENNAIAVVDLSSEEIVDIWPLGWKDWSKYKIDTSDRPQDAESPNMRTYPGLYSWYHPDALVTKKIGGREYVFTANEGDTKEEYKRFKTAGAFAMAVGGDVDFAAYKADEQLGRLDIDTLHGFAGGPAAYDRRLPFNAQTATRDKLIATGGRSFSILDASNGALVYDSGDAIESAIANDPVYSAIFNTDNDENSFRSRSPKKGPEPETIEVFQLRNKWFAAVGLERQSGMMLFDVTVPEQSTYVGYVTDRPATNGLDEDQLLAAGASLAPEMIEFVPASSSPTGGDLLLVSNEGSSTLSIYSVQPCGPGNSGAGGRRNLA